MDTQFAGNYSLIADGHWESSGYHSPFAALMAIACHCLLRGISEDDFVAATWRAGSAVKGKSRVHGENMSRQAFRKAKNAPSIKDALVPAQFMEDMHIWVSRISSASWRGRGASSERLVLDSLTVRALAAFTTQDLNGSVRLLSEETLLSVKTVSVSLQRLVKKGWIAINKSKVGSPSRVTLRIDECNVFVALAGNVAPQVLPIVDGPQHEAFRRVGLRGHSGLLYGMLVTNGTFTVAELATNSGLTHRTVRETLHRLASFGLAARVDNRHWVVGSADLDVVASDLDLPGVYTAGLRDRLRAAHARERWGYEEVLNRRIEKTASLPRLVVKTWISLHGPADSRVKQYGEVAA
jgi:predicted transcriptional regulator